MGDTDTVEDKKKAHRDRLSGRKADKKKSKKNSENGEQLTDKQKNPKAFTFNSAVRAERRFRRKQDLDSKKQHVPLVDRTPIEPPPILIAIVGPPKVGKSTVINNLIKLFTKSPLVDIKGPVTIVTGKKRRITLVECNNDINCMIDIAKVADLVLLLIDASFGFEMEIFEFLNICQVHGMPRIMGILTHLDMIKNNKTLKNTKKILKHRFWTEVYPGAKLFYLSGILHGEYLRNEIKNLGRFISVIKFRPLTWRTTHSYMLGDRYEDLTSQEMIRKNPKCDRTISLYGYMRGVPLNKNSHLHIAGLGDTKISSISFLPDPCPLPETTKKRSLIEKEKFIYAPFSGVGGIVYDKDAVYVELGGSHNHQVDNATKSIVANLIDTKETLDVKMEHSELQLFTGGSKLTAKDLENCEDDDIDPSEDSHTKEAGFHEEKVESDGRIRRRVVFSNTSDADNNYSSDESDEINQNDELHKLDIEDSSEEENSENDEEENGDEHCLSTHWKKNLSQKASDAFLNRQKSAKNLMKLVYGIFDSKNVNNDTNPVEEANENELGGLFKVVTAQQQKLKLEKDSLNAFDTSLFSTWDNKPRNWIEPENKILIENYFVTGKWKDSEDANELLRLDDMSDPESEVDGDFEDLETGEVHKAAEKPKSGEKRKLVDSGMDETEKVDLAEKKRKLKEKFDSEYDGTETNTYYDELKSSAEKQSQLNKSMFENMPDDMRVQIEGYRAGMYVRIEIDRVPSEFITNFDPTYPIVVGSLNSGEENIGFVNVRIKKHRWYKKLLKTQDPLIISMGWRRFQTLPLFSKLEDDMKFRYLKYTPEHVACNAHFWGPITPQGSGFLAIQSCIENSEVVKQQGFRIASTGAVQELDKSTQIMKKLKLIGYPLKIYKKTAFIKGMFNSALEVAKFEGASIKTVSGIRGQIKKAVSKPEGCFRATFEDKIQLSDIVFCRTWYKVDVPQFYNPVTSLLLPLGSKNSWAGLKTTGQLKRENNIKNQVNSDSLYTEIKRDPKVFKPLVIPRKLQQSLPYKDKPKFGVKAADRKAFNERVAVVREPKEQKVANMMKMLKVSFEHKQNKEKIAMSQRVEQHKQMVLGMEEKKAKRLKGEKKEVFRKKSKARIREEAKDSGKQRKKR